MTPEMQDAEAVRDARRLADLIVTYGEFDSTSGVVGLTSSCADPWQTTLEPEFARAVAAEVRRLFTPIPAE
jgi:hypothetical protein